jgi:serine/threonine-protein kinase HipA
VAYLDLLTFFERIVFNFLIGNGDMHLKNWPLLIQNKEARLAPCYDFVSTVLYLPRDEESALTINGKKNGLRRRDFLTLAETLTLDPKAATNALDRILGAEPTLLKTASGPLSPKKAQTPQEIIRRRCRQITSNTPPRRAVDRASLHPPT